MNEVVNRIISYLIVAIILVFVGVMYEKQKFDDYKKEVDRITAEQTAKAKAKDKEIQDNANKTASDYLASIKSIRNWYRDHPSTGGMLPNCVSVRPEGGWAMPGTDGNPSSTNGSTATIYVSPFDPESTEVVATRLYHLQQLLITNGVKIDSK